MKKSVILSVVGYVMLAFTLFGLVALAWFGVRAVLYGARVEDFRGAVAAVFLFLGGVGAAACFATAFDLAQDERRAAERASKLEAAKVPK